MNGISAVAKRFVRVSADSDTPVSADVNGEMLTKEVIRAKKLDYFLEKRFYPFAKSKGVEVDTSKYCSIPGFFACF